MLDRPNLNDLVAVGFVGAVQLAIARCRNGLIIQATSGAERIAVNGLSPGITIPDRMSGSDFTGTRVEPNWALICCAAAVSLALLLPRMMSEMPSTS